jgi:outer membrane protein
MDRIVLMSSSYIRGSDLQRPMLSGRARKTHLPQPWKSALAVLLLGPLVGPPYGISQSAPSTATKPWFSSEAKNFVNNTKSRTEAQPTLDAETVYSLAELIDIAELHNPDTRAAWQAAKTRAAELGVAKGALYPALAAIALAGTNRHGELIGNWTIQTIGVFRPTLNIEYLIFDFGGRSGAIAAARANLFASNFAFNDTHRKIIYDVMLTYYRLLDAIGRQDAAKASLANARAVEKDAADRLDHGLATNPDVLEAIATRAHAEYELADVLGAQEIAQGDLATVLGLPADTVIAVQGMDNIATPTHLAEAADQMIDRAFEQRPDLMERVAHLREAEAELQQAKSAYLPSLSFSSALGKERAYGQQTGFPGSFATAPQFWNVELSLKWTIFDGGKRESEVAGAKARRSRAQAEIDAMRDRLEDEVWRAYTNAKTAFRQQEAASAQLLASDQSYTAALRAYDLGVRNLLDVLAAQRALADARTADVTAHTEVLSQVANLAFTTADLLILPAAHPHP